jgi:hypothetical protein
MQILEVDGMPLIIRFRTARFDLDAEPVNPINPILGISTLYWLQSEALPNMQMTAPAPEDWGWYCMVEQETGTYLIGACAYSDTEGNHDWMIQVERHRSLLDKLLGRNQMRLDDPCLQAVRSIISRESSFTDVSVE